jgi:hypothetical protein
MGGLKLAALAAITSSCVCALMCTNKCSAWWLRMTFLYPVQRIT